MLPLRRAPLLLVLLVACTTATGSLRPSPLGGSLPAEAALAQAEAAASRPDADGRTLALAGWTALIRGGTLESAHSRFLTALERSPAEPLAHLGLAELAVARADHRGAASAYLSLLSRAPGDPLGELAVRRLGSVLGYDPATDAEARGILERLLDAPETAPRTRSLAREVLSSLRAAQGELEDAMALERGGAPGAWAVVGPFSPFRALDKDRRFPPGDERRLRPSYASPVGEISPRGLPTPDGILGLSGEPSEGDIFYAAVDATVRSAGPHLLRWRSQDGVLVEVDGIEVLRRDEVEAYVGNQGFVGLSLSAGTHRIIARIQRGGGRGVVRLELLDAQGRPAPVTWQTGRLAHAPPVPEPWPGDPRRPPVVVTEAPSGLLGWVDGRQQADPTDALAAYLGALYLTGVDTQRAKTLLAVALDTAPAFAAARQLEARIAQNDPALPTELRAGRVARAAGLAAQADEGHVPSRLALAQLAVEQERYEDAEGLLSEIQGLAPAAPELWRLRARLLRARGLPVLARQASEEALRRAPAACSVLRDTVDARSADEDLSGTDEAIEAAKRCGVKGLSSWAEQRAARGELAAAADTWRRILRLDPAQVGPAQRLADLLVSLRRPEEGQKILEATAAYWPRLANVPSRIGELRAELGDDAGARRWRGLALSLDPSDLVTRRALAFQDGQELLAWGALDLEQAIRDYQAGGPDGSGADSVLVVDHSVVEAMGEAPEQVVVLERIQTVTQVRTKKAIDQQGEVSIPEGAEVVALHVRKPDGRILEPESVAEKDRVSLRGLEVGDFVLVDYVQSRGPRLLAMPGWTAGAFYLRVFDVALQRSSYAARAPAALGLEVEAHNVQVQPPVREGEYLVFRHLARNVPPLQREDEAVGSDEYLPWFRVGAGAGPTSYGEAWGDFIASRTRTTPEVTQLAEVLRASLAPAERADPRALVAATAALADRLVKGRQRSSELSDVGVHALLRGRGNRLLATRTLLGALGIRSRVALVRPFQADPAERRFPAGDLYTHALLRVEVGEGGHLWLDQNVRTSPVGLLRPIHAGQPALLLAEPGQPSELIQTPAMPRESERKEMKVRLTVDGEGHLLGEGVERYHGFSAAIIRTSLEAVDLDRRRQVIESGLTQSFGPLVLEALAFEGDDPDEAGGTPLGIRYRFRAERWARVHEQTLVLPGGTLFPAQLSRRMIRTASRQTPLLLDNDTLQQLEAVFVLPEGARAEGLPAPVSLEGPFGRFSYRATAQDGELTLTQVLGLSLSRVAPDDYLGLARFAAAVDQAQAREIAVRLGQSESTARTGK